MNANQTPKENLLSLLAGPGNESPHEALLKAALTCMEHCRRMRITEGDVEYAANLGGYIRTQAPPSKVPIAFKRQVREHLRDFKCDVPVATKALQLLWQLEQATKEGTVTSSLLFASPERPGTTRYKLESPVGVEAVVYSFDFDAALSDDSSSDEEEDEDEDEDDEDAHDMIMEEEEDDEEDDV
jgi:hypothetical protein